MPDSLKITLEQLYATFARYGVNSHAPGCPHCVLEQDHKRLYQKFLRELGPEDLAHFAFKALSTWGDAEDFRHFLPRICELTLSTTPIPVDNEIIFGKLALADWRQWPAPEQSAVTAFIAAWGEQWLMQAPDSSLDYLCVYALVMSELEGFLQIWGNRHDPQPLCRLAALVLDYAGSPKAFSQSWWREQPDSGAQLRAWLRAPEREAALEAGFFRYQTESFAGRLAQAADLLRALS